MRRASVVLALALVGVGLGAAPSVADPGTLVVDADGTYNATTNGCDGTDSAYTSVQAAVTAANAGDTVLVCPGTYTEQVTIAKDNLTLKSVVTAMPNLPAEWYIDSGSAMIKAPSGMSDEKTIVHVDGATGVMIDGFRIYGPGDGPSNSIRYGIRVDNGGSATINRNAIIDIRDQLDGSWLSGYQNGIGIRVGRKYDQDWFLVNQTGTATITNNGL